MSLALKGHSDVARALRRRVGVLAETWRPALISGPFGAGQAEVGRALHAASRRAGAPCVQIDCLALPPAAPADFVLDAAKAAGEGTLVLAWVEALMPAAQQALAAALADGAFQPGMPLRARLVCCTADRDGVASALRAAFTEHLVLPSLSARAADLGPIVAAILAAVAEAEQTTADAETLAWIAGEDWPGDLTQLAAVVATVASSGMPLSPRLLDAVRRRRH